MLEEFAGCLARLGLDHVDLLLLHWPGDKAATDAALQQRKRAEMWRALETIHARGEASQRRLSH